MSVLIKGMEMPIFEHQSWDICKGTDGKWYMVDNNAETSDGAWHEIVPVPSHGDLISRETAKLYHSYLVDEITDIRVPAIPLSVLNVVPSVIPAEEEKS